MAFEIGLLVFPNITRFELHGEDVARSIQLGIEYDPAPPFASCSPEQAAPELVSRTREAAQARQNERRKAVRPAAAKLAT